MKKKQNISASMEDYLEAIFFAVTRRGVAQAKDIAESLNVKAGTVTGALQNLQKAGYINYAPYQLITLTEEGMKRASSIAHKHQVLKNFFADILGIGQDIADKAACRVEHNVGDELVDRLVCFTEMIQSESTDLIEKFKQEYDNIVA